VCSEKHKTHEHTVWQQNAEFLKCYGELYSDYHGILNINLPNVCGTDATPIRND
jgi:hypothetical protein